MQLSGQLASSCQLLFHESSSVLYHENVLSVEVDVYGSGSPCRLTVLDSRIPLPRTIGTKEELDLLSLSRRRTREYRYGTAEAHDCARIWGIYPGLRHFENFEVKLEYGSALGVAVAVVFLANC